MKGIIWAGDNPAGLSRLTDGMAAHLLPVYDKPMIYYPLSLLVLAGLRDLRVVGPSGELDGLRGALGDGSRFGVALDYVEQDPARDEGQVFDGVGGPVMLAAGDSFLHGAGLPDLLRAHVRELNADSAGVRFRHVGRDTGLGIFAHRAAYHDENGTQVVELDRRIVHHRTSTYDGLLAASRCAQLAWRRDGVRVGCVEESAWRMGLLDDARLHEVAGRLAGSGYGAYLTALTGGGDVTELPQAS